MKVGAREISREENLETRENQAHSGLGGASGSLKRDRIRKSTKKGGDKKKDQRRVFGHVRELSDETLEMDCQASKDVPEIER